MTFRADPAAEARRVGLEGGDLSARIQAARAASAAIHPRLVELTVLTALPVPDLAATVEPIPAMLRQRAPVSDPAAAAREAGRNGGGLAEREAAARGANLAHLAMGGGWIPLPAAA